jgi:hypothetical protein
MKKPILFAGIAILFMFSVAQASTITYYLDAGNVDLLASGVSTPYATVLVDLTDSKHATVNFTSNYVMFDSGMIDLNVNAVNFSYVLPHIVTTPDQTINPDMTGTGNISEFGWFNFTVKNFDGPKSGVKSYTFYLEDLSGTWASASDVLIANKDGHFAAAHIFPAAIWTDGSTLTQTGYASNKVPEANTMILLGSGLLGLAFFGRRKFWK